uniref:IS1162 DNA n=1 Tax=Pseudomonas fluorescens TaxID=294 RepID=Q51764_PSEFL|nr:unnamed protein product [Pseudomonas fluorescens]
MPGIFLQRRQAPVVQNQDIDLGQLLQGAPEATVAVGDAQLLQQARGAQVQRAVALATGLVAQGAGEPGLADAGRAGQQQVVPLTDPVTTGQGRDQALVQRAATAPVEVFQAGAGVLELGLFTQPLQALVVAPGQLAVEQQAEALIEAQAVAGRQRPLFFQCSGHAAQPQLVQLAQGVLGHHRTAPLGCSNRRHGRSRDCWVVLPASRAWAVVAGRGLA